MFLPCPALDCMHMATPTYLQLAGVPISVNQAMVRTRALVACIAVFFLASTHFHKIGPFGNQNCRLHTSHRCRVSGCPLVCIGHHFQMQWTPFPALPSVIFLFPFPPFPPSLCLVPAGAASPDFSVATTPAGTHRTSVKKTA